MAILQSIKVPLLAVNDTVLSIVEVNVKHGSRVKTGDVLFVFETSKTTYDVVAETEGFIELFCKVGEEYEVNQVVANIFEHEHEITAPDLINNEMTARIPSHIEKSFSKNWEGETLFSHHALQLIKKNNLSLSLFSGRAFVSKDDVLYVTSRNPNNESTFKPSNKNVGELQESKPLNLDLVDFSKLSFTKKKEIEFLSSVQSQGLTSTISVLVKTDNIFQRINTSLKYFKNSLLPIVIYESSRLLTEFKDLNAYYANGGIAYYKFVKVGFAIDQGKGLKVLGISNSNHKTIHEIEESIFQLSSNYLDDSILMEDLSEVTFTITDLSSEGVFEFRPLVNFGNSGILGISSIDEALNRCTLSLTFDHRVTEGKLVAQFLNELKLRLESYIPNGSIAFVPEIQCYKCHKKLKEEISEIGFIKCITPTGIEKFVCQSCYKGF